MNNTKYQKETPEQMDMILRRCQILHDETVCSLFKNIFKSVGKLFAEKKIMCKVHVK
jgi:hypothetical protein